MKSELDKYIYTGEICTVSNNHNKYLYDTIFYQVEWKKPGLRKTRPLCSSFFSIICMNKQVVHVNNIFFTKNSFEKIYQIGSISYE